MRERAVASVATLLILGNTLAAHAQALSVASATRAISANEFEWTLYVDGADDSLKQLKKVEYLLDRSFSSDAKLFQSSSERANGFAISSFGQSSLVASRQFAVSVRLFTATGVITRDLLVRPVQPSPGTEAWRVAQLLRSYETAYSGQNADAMAKLWADEINLRQEYRRDFRKHSRTIELGEISIVDTTATVHAIFRDETVDRFGNTQRTPNRPRISKIDAIKDGALWKVKSIVIKN